VIWQISVYLKGCLTVAFNTHQVIGLEREIKLIKEFSKMKGFVKIIWFTLFTLSLSLQGCGGGGGSSDDTADTGDSGNNISDDTSTGDGDYTGSESQAVVNEDNAKDLAVASASGVKQAVDESGMMFISQPASKDPASSSGVAIMGVVDSSADLCPHGGEAIVEYDDATQLFYTAHMTSCTYGGAPLIYTFTGEMHFSLASDSPLCAFTLIHDGSMSVNHGAAQEIYRVYSCDDQRRNCNFFSDQVGYDGRVYRVSDAYVTDEGSSAYTAAGRIYDPVHGYVDVNTEIPFTLDCPNDRPGAGRLSFTGADQTAGTIEFISCDEYVVTTDNGTSNTYSW
jgi:hypothetical protein